MRWLRRALLLALIIGVMVVGWRFASENQEAVTVHYLAGEWVGVPLWQLIVGAFAAGAGLVALFALYASARNGLARRRYCKAIGGLEAEIHQLRNLPLDPDAAPSKSPTLAPGSGSPEGSPLVGALPTRGASGRNG